MCPSSKRNNFEYILKIEFQNSALKLPHYEFDKMRPTLLVIDDELEMLWFIGEIFSNDFNVVTLQDPERIEQVMNEVYPNVIICDVMMPEIGGIELTKRIKSVRKKRLTFLLSWYPDRHEMEQQMAALLQGQRCGSTNRLMRNIFAFPSARSLERKEVLKTISVQRSVLLKNGRKNGHIKNQRNSSNLF